jgi:RNA polymerase sigma factor (sigma-70 family)
MNQTVTNSSLEVMLEKLRRGDASAAADVFSTYEPYLRMIVRRQLSAKFRSKFDSIDVVQSVWADTLRGFRENAWQFTDANHLRAFLIKAVRNRFFDRYRESRQAVKRAQPIAFSADESVVPSSEPRPSEEAQARDLWEHLLSLCPPNHRELLHLKREGLPLAEIAARTGLHQSSVRRILYELRRKLDSKDDSSSTSGDARS